MAATVTKQADGTFTAPHPGSKAMPQWDSNTLIPPPVFRARNWFAMLGPALLTGGAAIGGGEWLMGPVVTARYGGGLMWLATLSILGQVVYNIEISRYTLYTGEPIFTGKFRSLPGPMFWLFVYIVLDFGALFPYLAANAATPLTAMFLGRIPSADGVVKLGFLGGREISDTLLLRFVGIGVFLAAMIPLTIGGKVYNSLKLVMTAKIVLVLGFLSLIAFFFSRPQTWWDISIGFVEFGNMPTADGELKNIFVELWRGNGVGWVYLGSFPTLAAFAAIAGMGGLTNTPISNYTRDQGWGMGHHVGAIPSVIGGHNIALSHVGSIFQVSRDSLVRWKQWVRHVARDQLVIWMPACFVGLALPSMLSLEFLPRGTVADNWTAAGLTADGLRAHVSSTSWGPLLGSICWYITLLCGFLALGPTTSSTADGFIRRWLDVVWTGSRWLREVDPKAIKYVYFGVLCCYAGFGVVALSMNQPMNLLKIATTIGNFALGFSCFHTLYVNLALLPKELRPGWFVRTAMFCAGTFFLTIATISALAVAGVITAE